MILLLTAPITVEKTSFSAGSSARVLSRITDLLSEGLATLDGYPDPVGGPSPIGMQEEPRLCLQVPRKVSGHQSGMSLCAVMAETSNLWLGVISHRKPGGISLCTFYSYSYKEHMQVTGSCREILSQ